MNKFNFKKYLCHSSDTRHCEFAQHVMLNLFQHQRHCEERSDEAIYFKPDDNTHEMDCFTTPSVNSGFVRNDMLASLQNTPRHCEERSDEAIYFKPDDNTHEMDCHAAPAASLAMTWKMNVCDDKKKAAFSLVEAMIILVLISVAIMALIPLLNAKKTTTPKWAPTRIKDGATFGNPNGGLFYGTNSVDRVGIGSDPSNAGNPINPYDTNINAKLAVNKLFMRIDNNDANLLSSIVWGDDFNDAVNPQYAMNSRINTNSIQIGMNTCADTPNDRIIIRGNNSAVVAADPPNYTLNCQNYTTPAGNNIGSEVNIGNRIFVSNDGLRIGVGDNRLLDISPIGGVDNFAINYPDFSTALNYNGVTLFVVPRMQVNGDLYLMNYTVSSAATSPNITTANCPSANSCNFTCDTDPTTGECTKRANPDGLYHGLSGSDDYSFFGAVNDIFNAAARPSDIRLKNIISKYAKGITDVSKIDTYLYTYKSDKTNKTYVGIIAQKLIGIFDEALHKDSKGYYSYEREPLMYAMTNSAKEINNKQDELSKKQKTTNAQADKLIRMYK